MVSVWRGGAPATSSTAICMNPTASTSLADTSDEVPVASTITSRSVLTGALDWSVRSRRQCVGSCSDGCIIIVYLRSELVMSGRAWHGCTACMLCFVSRSPQHNHTPCKHAPIQYARGVRKYCEKGAYLPGPHCPRVVVTWASAPTAKRSACLDERNVWELPMILSYNMVDGMRTQYKSPFSHPHSQPRTDKLLAARG